jgi:hypothetical protein
MTRAKKIAIVGVCASLAVAIGGACALVAPFAACKVNRELLRECARGLHARFRCDLSQTCAECCTGLGDCQADLSDLYGRTLNEQRSGCN